MSYQVLARKWRPRRFADLVGQEHVVQPLANALAHDRLHHAFLFSGTRGVGKTTIARILAKALNCDTGMTAEPCGTCASCREVDEGRFVDLIEVDAASRTKVDDTRELLDNVQYAPTRGRFKVYLIDEVHMLSGHSFNALLKTLEEPPPHVKFLLATTEPQKLPVTVLSRCLQFHLKRLRDDQIETQLEKILKAEAIEFDAASLHLLARSADGSLRDALSLLDQAIAHGGGKVSEPEVRAMLGSIDRDTVARLIEGLAANDAGALLAAVQAAMELNLDGTALLEELLRALHRIALAQAVPATLEDPAIEERELLRAQSARLAPEDVQLYYQVALLGRRDLPLAPDPRTGLEMTLLRMLAFRPQTAAEPVPGRSVPPAPGATPAAPVSSTPAKRAGAVGAGAVGATPATAALPLDPADWATIVARLPLTGLARELVNHCVVEALEGERLRLILDAPYAHLHGKEREQQVQQALAAYFGRELRLEVRAGKAPAETPAAQVAREHGDRLRAAATAIASDPNVRALEDAFGARVNPNSVRPRSNS